jgi:DNA-binding PadR family transcriptional regulator
MRRLRASGYIEDSTDAAPAAETADERGRGAPRRTYRLTALGRTELRRELARLDSLLDHARALRLVPGRR